MEKCRKAEASDFTRWKVEFTRKQFSKFKHEPRCIGKIDDLQPAPMRGGGKHLPLSEDELQQAIKLSLAEAQQAAKKQFELDSTLENLLPSDFHLQKS